MAGMRVTVPSSHWSIHEDHPGEFNLSAPSPRIANIHFWLDPYPSLKNDKPLPGVGRTPAALIAWMKATPAFKVSAFRTVGIAGGVMATSFTFELSRGCIDFFVFRAPGYDFPYGLCSSVSPPSHLYLATLGSGAKAHTFVIAIDAKDVKTLAAILPSAEKIITNAVLPAKVTAG